jgi:antitoxin ParD1/3/4
MPTRNVVLTAHHESIIETLVSSGRYKNASEVPRDGLRLIEQREALETAKLHVLQAAAQTGFADIDQGHYRDLRDDELDDFIASRGHLAGKQVQAAEK